MNRRDARARDPALCGRFFRIMRELGFVFEADHDAGRVIVTYPDLPSADIGLIQSETNLRAWFLLDETEPTTTTENLSLIHI